MAGKAKKFTKGLIKSQVKRLVPSADKSKSPVAVKFGKPLLQVSYGTIKCLTAMSVIFLVGNILLSLKLFLSAVSVKKRIGIFINMVSKGDGEILPMMQALPVLVFLSIDVACGFFLLKLFDVEKKKKINWFLFLCIVVSLVMIVITLVLVISIIAHIYHAHEGLHNGITEAMMNYSGNSVYKKQIDRLQIEFQCCGSKKYDEWYTITWYDKNLLKNSETDNSEGNTPFSCCSMASIFPCIHHNIERTGKVYLYTPEQNLSISTRGCYGRLREKKQEIGWEIIGNLFLYIVLQIAMIICLRLLQTGHFVDSKFSGHSKLYTVWLIGCYTGKKESSTIPTIHEETEDESPVEESGHPPEPPPVPEDLKT